MSTPDMPVVYVAGPYNANGACAVMENIREGVKLCRDLMRLGVAPVCPWLDHVYLIQGEVSEDTLKAVSMAMLRKSDAVLVNTSLPGWEQSKGTAAEIAEAKRLGIPVSFCIEGIEGWLDWRREEREAKA